ncbi:MAG: hypothetical protein ACFFBH_17435 [Promethearchaeota archaeon]
MFKLSKKHTSILTIIAGVQFIIMTIIAMIIYPGGYSFWNNFFSHLGYTISYNNGQPSIPSYVIFASTCTITAILLIPFWCVLTSFFRQTTLERYLSFIGTLFGLLSCPNLALLAIFPGNLLFEPHIIVTRLFFMLFAAAMFTYSIAILINKDYENYYAIIGFGIGVIIVLYILIFLYNAALQKVTVYLLITWGAIQGIKLWKS